MNWGMHDTWLIFFCGCAGPKTAGDWWLDASRRPCRASWLLGRKIGKSIKNGKSSQIVGFLGIVPICLAVDRSAELNLQVALKQTHGDWPKWSELWSNPLGGWRNYGDRSKASAEKDLPCNTVPYAQAGAENPARSGALDHDSWHMGDKWNFEGSEDSCFMIWICVYIVYIYICMYVM
jgi:hypothetical protein